MDKYFFFSEIYGGVNIEDCIIKNILEEQTGLKLRLGKVRMLTFLRKNRKSVGILFVLKNTRNYFL